MEALRQVIPTLFQNVQEKCPVIESITNVVTVNDCANIVLASGGSPTMADHPEEVEEIQAGCDGLVLNIGNISPIQQEAMLKAGKVANQYGHPIVLDPVGAGASHMRNEAVKRLLSELQIQAIRGNISEMKAVAQGSSNTRGVDANPFDLVTEKNLDQTVEFAKTLSKEKQSIIAISGAIDIVTDGERAYLIKNGHPMMAKVTGTGCMVTHVVDVFLSANQEHPLEAVVTAIAAYAYSGELAYERTKKENGGTSMFRMYLIDYMSNMTAEYLLGGMKVEER